MLTGKAKRLPRQPDLELNTPSIPDPWLTSKPVERASQVPKTWHIPAETYPIIGPAGNPKAPRLVSHQSTSEEILLEDELKLQISANSRLKQQLAQAFTLLYWIGTNHEWQMAK